MTRLIVEPLPELRDPALVLAFAGWGDAGEAATAAVRWLVRHLPGRRVGGFDPEDYHAFTDSRPTVRYVDGERRISWPAHDLYLAAVDRLPRDLLLYVAKEPELRWRTYCRQLADLARQVRVEVVVTFGAFLSDAPHSRPVPITGFATTDTWWSRLRGLGAAPSNYQGPTSIVSVVHDLCREAGVPSASLWAAVPHYLPTTANPKAALALLHRLDQLLSLGLDLSRLESAAAFFERQVNEAVSRDRRMLSILRDLERRAETGGAEEAPEPAAPSEPLPSAEEVIRDLEEFLRGRSSDSED
jgi:predicted ATP-grasp superfamily ATP-dependent carboligase